MKRLFRLRQTTDIQRVRDHGRSQRNQYVVLLYYPQPADTATTDFARVGVIAGKRIGSAVTRNKVKRQLKAIMQVIHVNLPERMDILLIARQPIIEASFQQMESAVHQLLQRAELLDGDYVQSTAPASK
ncbi:MAG: ribonuclease P protein component [Anaerolineae bacterium]|nr:ribonuclease P protein component [Anaerolineae bacterium]